MKKTLLAFLLMPVLTEAQTTKATTTNSQVATPVVLSSNSSSLPTNNKALIVVDGVTRNGNEQQGLTSAVNFGNQPNTIAPDKIKSVTVLNGASATALYGPGGANGAIIVTTQK